MNRLIVVTAALLLSGCAVNGDWSSHDTALEISYQVVNAMDAVSTARIADTPDWTPIDGTRYIRRIEEAVPLTRAILGPRPSKSDTYIYFATMGVSHWLIARSLPPKWRPWFQGGTTLLSAKAVIGNCDNGLC